MFDEIRRVVGQKAAKLYSPKPHLLVYVNLAGGEPTSLYAAELHELDSWILEQVGHIPAEKRLLVTNHEAFGYFAERYGCSVVGTVVESMAQSPGRKPPEASRAGFVATGLKTSRGMK